MVFPASPQILCQIVPPHSLQYHYDLNTRRAERNLKTMMALVLVEFMIPTTLIFILLCCT